MRGMRRGRRRGRGRGRRRVRGTGYAFSSLGPFQCFIISVAFPCGPLLWLSFWNICKWYFWYPVFDELGTS